MVAREGIEPPTRGFSAADRVFRGFNNQSLAAACQPLPRHTKAQSWHTQSELVTNTAQQFRPAPRKKMMAFRFPSVSVRLASRSLRLLSRYSPREAAILIT